MFVMAFVVTFVVTFTVLIMALAVFVTMTLAMLVTVALSMFMAMTFTVTFTMLLSMMPRPVSVVDIRNSGKKDRENHCDCCDKTCQFLHLIPPNYNSVAWLLNLLSASISATLILLRPVMTSPLSFKTLMLRVIASLVVPSASAISS